MSNLHPCSTQTLHYTLFTSLNVRRLRKCCLFKMHHCSLIVDSKVVQLGWPKIICRFKSVELLKAIHTLHLLGAWGIPKKGRVGRGFVIDIICDCFPFLYCFFLFRNWSEYRWSMLLVWWRRWSDRLLFQECRYIPSFFGAISKGFHFLKHLLTYFSKDYA